MRRIKSWVTAAVLGVSLVSSAFGQTTGDVADQQPQDTQVVLYFPKIGHEFFKADRTTKPKRTPPMPYTVDEVDGEWYRIKDVWCRRSENVAADEAIAYYSNALLNGQDKVSAMLLRAHVWTVKGDYQRALVDYTAVINLDEDFVPYRGYRAEVFYKLKDSENAIADLQEVLRRRPDDLIVSLQLGWLLATTPDAKYREPRRALQIAQQEKGSNQQFNLGIMAAAYADLEQFDRAVKCEEESAAIWRSVLEEERQSKSPSQLSLRRCSRELEKSNARLELYKQRKPYRDEERWLPFSD